MGVPFYYRWLTTRYPNISLQLRRNEISSHFQRRPVESLGLDLNGIIHTEASKVYLYGENETKDERKIAQLRNTPSSKLEYQHFTQIAQSIYDLTKLTNPRDSLFICVDGPAPFPKLYQQKQRRFKAKSTVIRQENSYVIHDTEYHSSSIFDSNAITPGTGFMDRLDLFLRKWLKLNKKNLPPRVIYSSHRVPGEGEHKIAQYHRSLYFDPHFASTHTHVVYGLDADLILIGLLSPLKNYTLLRDDITAQGSSYHILPVHDLRTQILREVSSLTDYVLLTFFAGNDFLPPMPSVLIGKGGIDALLQVYKATRIPLTSSDNRIIWDKLTTFLTAFEPQEQKLLEEQARRPTTYPSVPLQEALGRNTFDLTKFQQIYYKRALGPVSSVGSIESEEKSYNIKGLTLIPPLVEEWLGGLSWILKYYTEGIDAVNVEWTYKYNYTPLIPDIITSLKALPVGIPSFEWEAIEVRGDVLLPLEQLVSVLPPASQNLLPEELRSLLTGQISPIADLTPRQFLADLSGRMKEHESRALLPYIDGSRVRDAVRNIKLPITDHFDDDLIIRRYEV